MAMANDPNLLRQRIFYPHNTVTRLLSLEMGKWMSQWAGEAG